MGMSSVPNVSPGARYIFERLFPPFGSVVVDENSVRQKFTDAEGNQYEEIYPLTAPPAASRQQESIKRFNDAVQLLLRDAPGYEGLGYATDQQYLNPEFRMQQAKHCLNNEINGVERYWAQYYCFAEVEELMAKENKKEFESRKKASFGEGRIYKIVNGIFSTLVPHRNKVMYTSAMIVTSCVSAAFFFQRTSSGSK